MIVSAPECRQHRDCSTVRPRIRVPASDIAAVDGNAIAPSAPFDLTSYAIADGDLANGKPATSIFQMARSLQCSYLLTKTKFLSASPDQKIGCMTVKFTLFH